MNEVTAVVLARHGQTNSNVAGIYMGRSDEDLNAPGRDQARRLSSRLAGLPVARVYTSPIRRAHATAAIIAEPHALEPEVTADLTELDLGDWQGLNAAQIRQRWPDLWQRSRMDPSYLAVPNGESFPQVTERAVRAFDGAVEANRGKFVILVTHEIVVKLIVAHALGATNSIYRRFQVANASLTVIRVADGRCRLVTLNDTSHLGSIASP